MLSDAERALLRQDEVEMAREWREGEAIYPSRFSKRNGQLIDEYDADCILAAYAESRLAAARAGERWKRVPDEQGWWWHWNGDYNCHPFIHSVMVSKTGPARYFVANGKGSWCDEIAGWWKKIIVPSPPVESETK